MSASRWATRGSTPRDETAAFEGSLDDELGRLDRVKAEFLAEFSADDYEYLVDRWRKKIDFCRQGELAWGVFVAERALPTTSAEASGSVRSGSST